MAVNKADLTKWARDLVLTGLDNVTSAIESATENPTPVQRLADHWRGLTAEEKEKIAIGVAGAAGSVIAAIPFITSKRPAKRVARKSKPQAAADTAAPPAGDDKKKDKKRKDKKDKKDRKDKKDKKSGKDKKKGKKKKK